MIRCYRNFKVICSTQTRHHNTFVFFHWLSNIFSQIQHDTKQPLRKVCKSVVSWHTQNDPTRRTDRCDASFWQLNITDIAIRFLLDECVLTCRHFLLCVINKSIQFFIVSQSFNVLSKQQTRLILNENILKQTLHNKHEFSNRLVHWSSWMALVFFDFYLYYKDIFTHKQKNKTDHIGIDNKICNIGEHKINDRSTNNTHWTKVPNMCSNLWITCDLSTKDITADRNVPEGCMCRARNNTNVRNETTCKDCLE